MLLVAFCHNVLCHESDGQSGYLALRQNLGRSSHRIFYFLCSFSFCFEDSVFINIRPKTGVLDVQPMQLPETPAQKDLALGV